MSHLSFGLLLSSLDQFGESVISTLLLCNISNHRCICFTLLFDYKNIKNLEMDSSLLVAIP